MLLKRILPLIAVLASAALCPAQSTPLAIDEPARKESEAKRDEIETDRDSFTPSTRTVSPYRLITEAAYSYFDYRGRPETQSFPELLLRYGATERIELRLGWNYEVGAAADLLAGENRTERENNLNVGIKVRLSEQNGWMPESSLILAALIPTGGPETSTLLIATYAFGWELPNRWKLDAAMRYGTGVEEHDHFSEWAPSIVLKVPVGEKWSVHAEYFGIFTSDKRHDDVIQYFSPGVHYLVTPDLEIGTRVGWGLNDQSARFFVNAGLGYRY